MCRSYMDLSDIDVFSKSELLISELFSIVCTTNVHKHRCIQLYHINQVYILEKYLRTFIYDDSYLHK